MKRITSHRPIFALAIPVAAGIMVQTSYHVVNAFWVGRLGADAVAVISLAFPVNLVIVSLASGLALGGTILVAQRHGAGDQKAVSSLAAQILSGMSMLALLITAMGIIFSPGIPALLGAGESIYADAVDFLRITFAGALFAFLAMSFQYTMRGLGEARAPLLVIVPSVLFNAILDPVLIFGWGPLPSLGVQGAALATVITQLLTAVAGIWLMLRPKYGLAIGWRDLAPHWRTLNRLLRLGIPASVEQSVGALSVSVMTVLATNFGTMALASYGIMFRLLTFTMIPAVGVSMATSILLGKSLGGGDTSNARRLAIESSIINFTMMAAIGAALYLAAPIIAVLFIPADPELAAYSATVIKIFALSYPFSGVQAAFNGVFRGAGDTFMAMVLTLVGTWTIQIPLAYLLSSFTTLQDMGLWWSVLIAAGFNAAIALVYFRSGRWKQKIRQVG